MAKFDEHYHEILERILRRGYKYEDPNRQGVQRIELASVELRHDLLNDGFPALTTKQIYFKGAVAELVFFLSGSTDIRDLWKNGVRFWDKDWARFRGYTSEQVKELHTFWKTGEVGAYGIDYSMGNIYPKQYRNFGGVDQLQNLINTLRDNPMSTSLIVNAWNAPELSNMCLPPCHYGFQVVARPLRLDQRVRASKIKLSFKEMKKFATNEEYYDSIGLPKYGFEIHWQQRSTDFFLGTPVNVMYYALLALLLEKLTGHVALAIQGDLKNVHLYDNQIDSVKEQLARSTEEHGQPTVEISRLVDAKNYEDNLSMLIAKLKMEDFELNNYKSYPPLKVDMLSYS